MLTVPLGLTMALAVAACSGGGTGHLGPSTTGARVAASGPTVVIGATVALSGSLGSLGQPLRAGYEQEIAHVNAVGGVLIGDAREKLRLVVLDNGGNPAAAVAQADELVRRDHAVALLGPAAPQLVLPVADAAEQLHVPLVTSQLPAEAFASGDKTGWSYAWDLFYDERQQATAVARTLAAPSSDKKVALFTDAEPDGVVERPLYEAAFAAAGLHVVGDYTFGVGTTNLAPLLAAAKKAGAQLLAGQLGPADQATLTRQLASSGFRPAAAFLAGTAAAGYQAPSPGRVAPVMLAGGPAYGPDTVGYAAAEVLTDALAAAGSPSPSRLNAAIGKTHAQTPAGLITFSPTTHTATIAYAVTRAS